MSPKPTTEQTTQPNTNNTTSDNKTLYLVDGSSYLFRAFFALPNLTTRDGKQPTGAILGVANMLRRLQSQYHPDYLAVIFDAKGKTFRHEQFAEYKATRPKMPTELAAQIEPLHELIDLMGIPRLVIPGVEADDVIATLAIQASNSGRACLISSGDKDLAQLVNEHITLEDTMQERILDPDGVQAKFGVPPALIGDYLALVGDTSDNIPGVPGVGAKTAAKWLLEYGSMDAIIEQSEQIKGKIGEKLRDNLDQLRLSRQLVQLKDDVELEVQPDELTIKQSEDLQSQLRERLGELQFNNWLKDLGSAQDSEDSDTVEASSTGFSCETHTILTQSDFDALLKKLKQAKAFAWDTETTNLDPMRAKLVGMSFAFEQNQAWYLPLAHDYPGAPEQLPMDKVLSALKPILENPKIGKLGQNLKYDINVLKHYDIQIQGIAHDTMLESYCYNSTAGRHNLDVLAQAHLNHTNIAFKDVAGSGKNQLTFNQVEIENAAPYAGEDAAVVIGVHQRLWPELEQLDGPKSVYQDIEIPLLPVLARIEYTGVLIDAEQLKTHSNELAKTIHTLEQQSFKLAGHDFNLGSPKQLQHILFEEMELPIISKTPKGQPSTAENVLHELARKHELPRLILEHRSLSKLKSTYTDKLPLQIHPCTGRVHTSYQQAVASTGRLSSSDPNLQNIPVRSEQGRRIRKAFIAPPGYVLLAADYSQVELRIMAHLSGDDGLLQAFHDGIDVHQATAGEVFDVEYDQVEATQRRAAKAINFGLMYGMSAWGLARQLDVEQKQAQAYINTYFERYPGVHDYMERTRQLARDQGYVETLFGRRLWLNEINARNPARRQGAERAAINAPMQGTAADIIKLAMLDIDQWLSSKNIDARVVMQVHDELVLEVNADAAEEITEQVSQRMSAAAKLDIPLVVDTGLADDWEAAH